MFSEDDLLPISALQHLLFCPRQCALIHVERLWAENSLTREGRHLHEKADKGPSESRPGIRIARGLPLRSFELGLIGKADVVEFREGVGSQSSTLPRPREPGAGSGCTPRPEFSLRPLPAFTDNGSTELTAGRQLTTDNLLTPFPIEYKRGKPKKDGSDIVQLCAQALCLEEMLGKAVPAGALFYGKTRRRVVVAFDEPTRRMTLEAIGRLHAMIAARRTPAAVYEPKKCDRCSLRFLCLPKAARSASGYLKRAMAGAGMGTGPDSE